MKITTVQSITVQDWDDLVETTYGRPYSFQQQDGCKERGVEYFTVPCEYGPWDYENDSVNEADEEMGVRFAAWLARDPKQELSSDEASSHYPLDLYWRRHFYPSIEMIADDLYKRGLFPAGEYQIVIDW